MDNLHNYCAKVLPTIYDDTLSYSELLCKLTDEVNKLASYETDIPALVEKSVEQKFAEIDVEQELAKIMDKYYINVKVPPIGIPAAVGDGVTDDTESVQGCIDYAAKNGGSVFFPSGTYICGQLVIANRVALFGQDRYSTIIKLKGATNKSLLAGTVDKFSALNIGFDGSNAGQTEQSYTVDITVTYGIFSNVYFANGDGMLRVSTSKNVQITDAHFGNSSKTALVALGGGTITAANLTFDGVAHTDGVYFIDSASDASNYTGIVCYSPALYLANVTANRNNFAFDRVVGYMRGIINDTGNYNTFAVNGVEAGAKYIKKVSVSTGDVEIDAKRKVNVNAASASITTSSGVDVTANGVSVNPGASGFTLPQPTTGDGYFDFFPANYPGGSAPFNFLVANDRTQYIGADENRTLINAKYPPEITELTGVAGDGATDDAAKINALLDWCANNGALLVLPCNCAVASTVYLPSNTGIIGAAGAKLTSIATDSNPVISPKAGATNCYLANVAIACADNQNAIALVNSNNGRYFNLTIIGGGTGFVLSPTVGTCNNNVIDTVLFSGTNIALQMVAENNTSVSQNVVRGFSGEVKQQSAILNRATNNMLSGLLVGATGTTINIALNSANGNVFEFTRGWIFARNSEEGEQCTNYFDMHTIETVDQIHAERNAVIYCRTITGETFIGTNSNTVISRFYGDAPSDFRHSAGSILFFRKADADGYIGKICTTPGTPGTWARFKFTVE